MSTTLAGLLQVAALIVLLAAVYVPFGNYLARVYTTDKHWRVERWIYRLVRVDPDSEQRWTTYAAAKAAIASNQSQVDADQIAYEGVKKEQEVGARTILDVLNAQQELLNAQVAVVSSQRDAYVAAYQLLQSTGQLTARHLKLNVKYYDPHEHYDSDHARWIGFGD